MKKNLFEETIQQMVKGDVLLCWEMLIALMPFASLSSSPSSNFL